MFRVKPLPADWGLTQMRAVAFVDASPLGGFWRAVLLSRPSLTPLHPQAAFAQRPRSSSL